MADNLNEKFSRELKSLRESKGISLEQIATKTRIDIKFLAAIEEGNFDIIDEIYIRAFIREYAQMLDLDGNEIIAGYDAMKKGEETESKIIDLVKKDSSRKVLKKEFDSSSITPNQSLNPDKITEPSLSESRKKMIMIGGIGLSVIIITILLFTFVFNSSSSQIITEPEFEDVMGEQTERYTADTESNTSSSSNVKDSLVLKMVASDTSWILVNKDDVSSEEFMMYRRSVRFVKALHKFNLTIGNSGGVSLLLNGDSLRFAGSKGQVKYLLVDKTGLRIITNKAPQNDE